MRRAVDEVGVGDQGGGEAHDGAVKTHDEDLGVGVEGLGDVEVVCYAIWRGGREQKYSWVSSFFLLVLLLLLVVSSNVAPVGWTLRRQRRFPETVSREESTYKERIQCCRTSASAGLSLEMETSAPLECRGVSVCTYRLVHASIQDLR